MPDDLTFLMGKYPAVLRGDRRYARNHMWCLPVEERVRCGFTAYAVRLMQDVYFLDWVVNPGDAVAKLQQIGHIETSKAVADLFAPLAGAVAVFNSDVLDDPSAINVDNYGQGWLFEMHAETADTMTVAEYHHFLADNWEKTQQTLKGHM